MLNCKMDIDKVSKTKQIVVVAYNIGYRIIDNKIFNPNGKELKCHVSKTKNYARFSRKIDGKPHSVFVHHLVAYQKFGDEWLYNIGLHVRHLDGNPMNNLENNIALGTPLQNMMDIDPVKRAQLIENMCSKTRKLTDDNVREIRNGVQQGIPRKFYKNKYNVSYTTIDYVVKFKTYKHVI